MCIMLKVDLANLKYRFNHNEICSEEVRERYPIAPGAARLNNNCFTNDKNRKTLKLNDKELCCSLTPNQVHDFWADETDSSKFFPNIDVIRIGKFFDRSYLETIHLVLKSAFEKHIYEKHNKNEKIKAKKAEIDFVRTKLLPALEQSSSNEKYIKAFSPDIEEIFDLMNKYYRDDKETLVYYKEFEKFEHIINKFIQGHLLVLANDSDVVQKFIEKELAKQEQLIAGTEEQQQEHWIQECIYAQKQQELGDALYVQECRKLENEQIITRWMAAFGENYTEMLYQQQRYHRLDKMLNHKHIHPDKNIEELMEIVIEQEKFDEEKITHLKKLTSFSVCAVERGANNCGGVPMSTEDVAKRKDKSRKILKDLYLTLHDVHLENHPNYKKLTEEQHKQLRSLFDKVLELRKSELGVDPSFFEYKNRNLEILEDAYIQAQTILENAGIDIDTSLIIQGNTIQEKIDWLKNKISLINAEITQTQANIQVLLEDKDIGNKLTMLKDKSKYEAINHGLKEDEENFKKKADEFQEELDKLFEKSLQEAK